MDAGKSSICIIKTQQGDIVASYDDSNGWVNDKGEQISEYLSITYNDLINWYINITFPENPDDFLEQRLRRMNAVINGKY